MMKYGLKEPIRQARYLVLKSRVENGKHFIKTWS